MSKFKGTQGKWDYNVKHRGSTKNSLIQVLIPIRKDYTKVLELGQISEDECTVAKCCCTESHANALLISKAPEMLEMLEEITEQANEIIRINSMGASETYYQLINKAEQLIKKATEL